MKVEYRPDIDGLRAIAVLSVVFYHYGIGSVHGGFVGVDIFFVISGYLITGIIHGEIREGVFTFAGFYERRIRRIFPALGVVLLVVLLAGFLLLLPSDLLRLANASISTIGFVANILYWRQSGYFDSGSDYNPLLHTWSLAVEEQFYIGLPVLLIWVHRFVKRRLQPILGGAAIASFLLCVWMQSLRPEAVFFLSPFRAWELLVGGLLAVSSVPAISRRIYREVLSIAALMVLLASLLWIKSGADFPGWKAAIPVFATAVLLHVGASGESIVRRLLSWRGVTFFGLISYSLYLWHWPLIVYARYMNAMHPLSAVFLWGLFLSSVILAYISYRCVEQPFRKRRAQQLWGFERGGVFWGAGLSMVGLMVIASVVKLDGGWVDRFPKLVVEADRQRAPTIPYVECNGKLLNGGSTECHVGFKGATENTAMLWGDSHALAWAPAFDEVGRKRRINVALAVHSSCPPLLGVSNPVSFGCSEFNKETYDWIVKNRPKIVYLVASWLSYSQPDGQYSISDTWGSEGNSATFAPALERTIRGLKKHAVEVVLVGPTPGAPSDVADKVTFNAMGTAELPYPILSSQFQEKSHFFWAATRKVSSLALLVDPARWFCEQETCKYMDSGKVLYRDSGHLSADGASFVAKHFMETVGRDVQQ